MINKVQYFANKKVALIAIRREDVYVLDMSSLTQNGTCLFEKASKTINWLWHKTLSHLNFKNIKYIAKQNTVFDLPSLIFSKDKPCSACEKGKHHRASFKTKQWLMNLNKNVSEALKHLSWVQAIVNELEQFERNKVHLSNVQKVLVLVD